MAKRRWLKWAALLGAAALAAAAAVALPRVLAVGAAYKAKLACSCAYVARRAWPGVLANELDTLGFIKVKLDRERRLARASLLGLGIGEEVAVYAPGLGCTLAQGADPAALAARGKRMPPPAPPDPRLSWPRGGAAGPVPAGVDRAGLARALDAAFAEPDPAKPARTRAVVVVFDGAIVAERYAPGFGPDTPQLGWSMAKSVTGALLGVLVGQGKLGLDQPAPLPAWQRPGDPRAAITLRELLRMQSGLAWEEDYSNPWGDVLTMLFVAPGAGSFAAGKPLARPPGSHWQYSSGSSNILCQVMRRAIGDESQYLDFPRQALFGPLGMASAVMEPDASGTWVGSSFVYAGARDWARFGLLYLDDGVWQGRRILPEGWVRFCATPAPASGGLYGAHWWLNAGEPGQPARRRFPGLLRDLMLAQGYEGQFVCVVPSRRAVVVRLGLTRGRRWDPGPLLAGVLAALPPAAASD